MHSIGNFMSLEDLDVCLEKLTWHKSPGKNNVSSNAVKVLELDLRIKLLTFLNEWLMNEDVTYLEWLIASLKVLPKKGDLKNPNNWRGIILLDINSKIISIFINIKLQKLLKTRGIAHQFGATPKLGCQDAVFVLKTFLQERREKLLDTWVVFIDLVKAYDSIQHKVVDEMLHIFGVPEIVRTWIKKLCSDSMVELKVGKFKHHIPYGCGVK